MGGLRREADGDLLQVAVLIQQGGRGEVVKAPLKELFALGELLALDIALTVGGVFRPQDHGDQGVPAFLGGGHQAVARLAGAAGLHADGAREGVARILAGGEQRVGVDEAALGREIGGRDSVVGGGDDLPEGGVGHGLLGHLVDVPGRGVVVGVVQTVGVGKVGARHAQLLGSLVHAIHKGGDVPADGHGQDVGRLVGRGDQQAVEQVLHRDDLPGLEVGGGGVIGDVSQGGRVHSDFGGQVQLTPAHGLQSEQGGHDLGDAGGVALLVGVLVVEDLVRVQVDEQGGRGVHRDGLHPFVFDGARQRGEQPSEQ